MTSLANSIHTQDDKLDEIHRKHTARLQESGILQKIQRAYIAEYMPIPSVGGGGLDISESLRPQQFSVSYDQNGDTEHIMIIQAQYHPILVGNITKTAEEPKIEANQKRGFNVLDVKLVASMVQELIHLKEAGELPDLSADLQRIEKPAADIPQLVSNTSASKPLSVSLPISQKSEINTEEAVRLLSYSDVLPEQHRQDAVNAIKKGETTLNYAAELVYLYGEHGKEKVEELARSMVEFCAYVLKKKNIAPTIYAPSISWALWDIAKQSYLAKHPEGSSPEYLDKLSDPFALTDKGDQKRAEIRERHVGWEVMRRWDQGEVRAADLPVQAQQILANGQRNETGQLRSYELAKLGHVVSSSLQEMVK